MKKCICTLWFAILAVTAFSQQTYNLTNPELKFKQAKEYYQKEYYSLAYPIFKQLSADLREKDWSNRVINSQEIKYYTIVCALKQDEPAAVSDAQAFVDQHDNDARIQMMEFHLGEYYFRQKDFRQAISSYEKTSLEHLDNKEIADMKFHQGYSYFNMQDFAKAKSLLNDIRQIPGDPNYVAANYYYGFITFNDKDYKEALAAFKVVENDSNYSAVTPFYITTIYYYTGEKDKAIEYAENKVKQGGQYYDLEMRQLLGHAYFEKQDYSKALFYLEDYVSRSEKVSRENLYELAYAQYQAGDLTRAIEGFKQLGGKQDSLAQNAMYLLADAYLKTDQKANARNAFLFCASNSSNGKEKEVSLFNYAKLSYELGYLDVALLQLQLFLGFYSSSTYAPEARELLIATLTNTNNYQDALILLQRQGDNLSENIKRLFARVLYGRAMELINDGSIVMADELLTRALNDPYNASMLPYINFWKGEIAYQLDKIEEASRFYLEYLKSGNINGEVNPTNAKYNLGYCFLRRENYRQALGFFEQVVKSPTLSATPLQQDAYIRAADCYYMSRDFKKAVAMYNQVLNFSWPGSDYATFQKAMVAGVTNGNEKVKLLQSISRVYPASSLVPDANMEIASTYLAAEKFTEAIPYLKNVVNASSTESLKPKAYLRLGIAYFNSNNNQEALDNYNKLIKQYPNSTEAEEALENAKDIYIEEGKTSEYIDFAKSMGKQITTSQQDSLTYAEAEVQFSNGNFTEALQKFEAYLTKFPKGKYSLEALYYKSEIYYNKKDWSNAAQGYEVIAERVPNKFGEKALLQAARLNFFNFQYYDKSEKLFTKLKEFATTQDNRLEAMRGLLRSQFQLKKWKEAVDNAKELLEQKGSNTDDKILANFALAKAAQASEDCETAMTYYRAVANQNKALYGAEARYQIAVCLFQQNKLPEAEKEAFQVVDKGGSYAEWVTRSYILLGDIYFKQKDYFNAKATYQSVVQNASDNDLASEAQEKYNKTIEEEKKNSKIGN